MINSNDENIVNGAEQEESPTESLNDSQSLDSVESDSNTSETKADSIQGSDQALAKKQKEEADKLAARLQLVSEFIDHLPKLINLETCKLNLRLCRDGLFIKEDFFREVMQAFRSWNFERSHNQLPLLKIRRKLYGEEPSHQFYLIEGRTCLVGYTLPCDGQAKRKLGIPYVDSKTIAAADYLHSRDPIFESLNDVNLVLKPGSSEIEVGYGEEKFQLPPIAIKDFHQVAKNSPILLRRFKKIREAQRYALVALVKILRLSKAVNPKKALLVPVGCEKYPPQAYRIFADWIFVFDRNYCLLEAYELRGRNLRIFSENELIKMSQRRGRRIDGLVVFRDPGRNIAQLRTNNHTFLLGGQCLQTFERFYQFYRSKSNLENKRYSLNDVLAFFVQEFKQAFIVNPKEVAWLLKGGKIKAHELRFNKRWLFLLNHRRIIFATIQAPGSYSELKIKPEQLNVANKGKVENLAENIDDSTQEKLS